MVNPDERAMGESRLRVYDLLVEALDRRQEVFDLVCSSDTPDDAAQRVRELFRVSDPDISRAVLDMPVARWTRSERERIVEQAQELRQELATSD